MRVYELVFVLGLEVNESAEGFFTIADEDYGGVLLGKWRLKAAELLLANKQTKKLIIVGWHHKFLNFDVWRSDVMKNLLIEVNNDNANNIIVLHQDKDGTLGNIETILSYLDKHNIDPKTTAYLTNFYHIPRASLLLSDKGINIHPIVAESLLKENLEEIKKDYLSLRYGNRFQYELEAINKLENL